jgi:hypothetical protein
VYRASVGLSRGSLRTSTIPARLDRHIGARTDRNSSGLNETAEGANARDSSSLSLSALTRETPWMVCDSLSRESEHSCSEERGVRC